MYYGFYTNSTIQHGSSGASYNMQLAYIFTVGACLIICFFSLLFRQGVSAFLDPKLLLDLGKIQESQKFPRKQFLCSFDFLLLSDHSCFITRTLSLDKEGRFLCAFKEIDQSENRDGVTQLGIWKERHEWKTVPLTDVQPLYSFTRFSITMCHRLGGANNRNVLSQVLEARSVRSRSWQGWFLPRPPSGAYRCLPSHCVLVGPSLGARLSPNLLFSRFQAYCLRAHLNALILT